MSVIDVDHLLIAVGAPSYSTALTITTTAMITANTIIT
jgi:hypothetical protein